MLYIYKAYVSEDLPLIQPTNLHRRSAAPWPPASRASHATPWPPAAPRRCPRPWPRGRPRRPQPRPCLRCKHNERGEAGQRSWEKWWKMGGRTENHRGFPWFSMVLRCFINFIYLKIRWFFVSRKKIATSIHTFSLDVSLIEPFFSGSQPVVAAVETVGSCGLIGGYQQHRFQ